ncbi:MAG: hypothetical protein OXU79_06870 [Gemmatimonadota bacterium]|nr:hypothetical protein [Gemmatimonadota bacterium]
MTLFSAQRAVARTISALFSPPLAAGGMSILLISRIPAPLVHRVGWLCICLVFATCVPVLYVGFLVASGKVDGYYIAVRSRRLIPLLASSASCLAGFILLRVADAPPALSAFLLSYVVLGLLAAAANTRWKISLHGAGVFGPLAMLHHLIGPSALFWLPVPLAVSWARMVLGAHSLPEVVAGCGIGFLVVWVVVALYAAA